MLISCLSFSFAFFNRSENFRDLLTVIFTYDWRGEPKVSQAILQLIVNLVSCNAIFLSSAFSLFARSFLPQNITTAGIKEALTVELGQRETRGWIHQTIQHILKQVPVGQSVLLTTLYENFPHKRFSKQILSEYVQQLLIISEYLPVLQYRILDLIIDRCLEIDVEIIIEESGDVRIQRDYDQDDDLYGDIFQLEDPNSSGMAHDTSANSGNGGDGDKPRIPKEVCELADKLDAMLMSLVSFFQKQLQPIQSQTPQVPSSSGSTQQDEATQRLYQHLMMIFEKRLLSAHKSKFVQFTIFYVTTRSSTFGEHLARRLYAIGIDKTQSSIMRQAAIMYLASFASRATFLSPSIVQELVSNLIKWSACYICGHNGQTRTLSRELIQCLQQDFGMTTMPAGQTYKDALIGSTEVGQAQTHGRTLFIDSYEYDDYGRLRVKEHTARQHEVLYAAVQSACYILCFYGTELAYMLSSDVLVKEAVDLVFTSRFDPLRYTLKSVRNEFLKLALHVGLFSEECWDCFTPDLLLIETDFTSEPIPLPVPTSNSPNSPHHAIQQGRSSNGSLATGQVTTSTGNTTIGSTQSTMSMLGPNTLESFFPFDPCLLQRLHQSIETCYRSWKGVPGMEDDSILFRAYNGRSSDMPIPSIETSYYEDGYDNASMVSSLAYTDGGMSMSLSSLPGEKMMRAMASSIGSNTYSLNVMRRNSHTQQRGQSSQSNTNSKGRESDPFGEGDIDDFTPGVGAEEEEDDDDDDDLDEDDDDEVEDGEDEDVFGQGMEMGNGGQLPAPLSSSPRGSYFAHFAAMQQQQDTNPRGSLPQKSYSSTALSSMPLTADSLRAISQGYGSGQTMLDERRPRMYSIGSTGSW